MKEYTICSTLFLQFFLGVLFLFLLPLNSLCNSTEVDFTNDIDSLKVLTNQCSSDTSRFNILRAYYWKYATYDMVRAKPVGKWAYNEIKNSDNLKAFSDGLDVLGHILESEENYDSAYVIYQKALSISQKIEHHERTSWSFFHLAYINEHMGDVDSASYYYNKTINFNKSVGFVNATFTMIIETANFFKRFGESDSTLFYFKNALEFSREVENKEFEIVSHLYIANFFNEHNNTKKRIEYLNGAIAIAEETKDQKTLYKIYLQNYFFA